MVSRVHPAHSMASVGHEAFGILRQNPGWRLAVSEYDPGLEAKDVLTKHDSTQPATRPHVQQKDVNQKMLTYARSCM